MQPNSNNPKPSHKKTWIIIGVICALAIIGVLIWRMIAFPD